MASHFPLSGDEAAVRRQLQKILASRIFSGSSRMCRFLRFVVERTLAGEGERLKEYSVAVEVFDNAGPPITIVRTSYLTVCLPLGL